MKRDWIRDLAERTGFPKISIYLPMEMRSAETLQNPTRLKNALAEARRNLHAVDEGKDVDALLRPAEERLDDFDFWQHQDQSLAVLIDESGVHWIKLPGEVEELSLVGERFYLRPLIRIFSSAGHGYLLCVTRDDVQLYKVRKHDLRPVDVPNMPKSLAKFRGMTEFDGNVGFHSNASGGQQGGSAGVPQYHSLGPSPDDYNEVELDEYLGQIAKAVDHKLGGAGAPLVIAAEPRTLGHLQNKLHYKGVSEENLKVDPASKSEPELHQTSWSLMQQEVEGDRRDALERLKARLKDKSSNGALRDINEIARASIEGRLEAVFIARSAHLWGTYNSDEHAVHVVDEPGPEQSDLIDFVAVRALQAGGSIYSMEGETAENLGPVAALTRY
ncbi:hypothetical protein L0F51_06180 [Afifella sp. H1R]|uniref:baeRF3 domain-containing protein n=1 Tax=Afifella sp. H1R TaxID=2908841 RepID=UPI001F3F5C86|nr:hypothetical protein [Afifella sp. H1R]MCF1503348.1 hypothetical protein [Afifella sp. H1R]